MRYRKIHDLKLTSQEVMKLHNTIKSNDHLKSITEKLEPMIDEVKKEKEVNKKFKHEEWQSFKRKRGKNANGNVSRRSNSS